MATSIWFIYALVVAAVVLYYMDKHGGENPEDIASGSPANGASGGSSGGAEQRAAALRAAALRKAQIDATR